MFHQLRRALGIATFFQEKDLLGVLPLHLLDFLKGVMEHLPSVHFLIAKGKMRKAVSHKLEAKEESQGPNDNIGSHIGQMVG